AVDDRDAARALVRTHGAGAALVIPAGTSDAVVAGRPAPLLLYTDPVKYLEVASVRVLVQEIRHRFERGARGRTEARIEKTRRHALTMRRRVERATARLHAELARLRETLTSTRGDVE